MTTSPAASPADDGPKRLVIECVEYGDSMFRAGMTFRGRYFTARKTRVSDLLRGLARQVEVEEERERDAQ